MVNPLLLKQAALLVQDSELRIVFVGVTTDPIIHGSCTFLCLRARRKTNCDEDSGRCSPSYNQLAGADLDRWRKW
jgi:hypothetical protein